MDGSDRKSNSSPSTPNKHRPSTPKGFDGNGKGYKENDKQKHFMSSTISAASKSNLSRKKILAEQNGSPDNQQRTPNLDSKRVQKASSSDSNRNSISELGDSEENSRPYDPSTNYLSPRPRFLRYKPNRRREIILRREAEFKECESDDVAPDSALDSVSSCGSLPQLEGCEEVTESDDEFEEVEDELRGWGLKGALKLLLLLLVLVLSTEYIVSMNSPTPSPVVQAVVDLRNGYRILQDHTYEYVNRNLGFFEFIEDKRVLDMEMEESRDELNENEEIIELDGGEIGGFSSSVEENEEDKVIEGEEEEEWDKIAEVTIFLTPVRSVAKGEEIGGKEEWDDDAKGSVVATPVKTVAKGDKIGEEEGEWDEIVGVSDVTTPVKSVAGSEETGEDEEEEWDSTAEVSAVVAAPVTSVVSDVATPVKSVAESDEIGEDKGEWDSTAEVSVVVATPVTSVANALEKEADAAVDQESIKEEIFELKTVANGNFTDSHKIGDESGSNNKFKGFATESVVKAVIGLSVVLSSIVASIVLGLKLRKGRNGRENYETLLPTPVIYEPRFEPPVPYEEEKPTDNAAKSQIDSMEEEEAPKATRERSHENRAKPTIELLGELEIGEMSTSLRSCGIKNSKVTESEVSSHSVDVQTPSSLPISTKHSKIRKSIGADQSGGKNGSTTPLRRSSRIKTRVTSP